MKLKLLKTRIFLDGAEPAAVSGIRTTLGFLDGVTTNPSLVAKNLQVSAKVAAGDKFTAEGLINRYRRLIRDVAERGFAGTHALPSPPFDVSVEVYADADTRAETMVTQAREMAAWAHGARIKLPITAEGLLAAETLVPDGIRLNMTLCFSQHQAASVHAATRGAAKGQVVVSPFVGRLDDTGKDGMSLVANMISMYRSQDSHVGVLAASVRTLEHLVHGIELGASIVTAPESVLHAWNAAEKPMTLKGGYRMRGELIPLYDLDLSESWDAFEFRHPLTDKGLAKFAADWNSLCQ